MNRRGFLGGMAVLLLPGAAVAQAPAPGYAPPPMGGQPPMMAPPGGPPPTAPQGRAGKAQRQPVGNMSWDEIPPKRRRKLQQRLAGPGNPPMPPDQARAMWDSMTPQQRRQAAKRQAGEQSGRSTQRRQQPMGQPPQ